MSRNILITGGAGFIGSRLCEILEGTGDSVLILDSLLPQVHGSNPKQKSELYARASKTARVIVKDIRNRHAVKTAIADADVIVHLAAETGTGQSMYQSAECCDVNVTGTAIILEELLGLGNKLEKFVLASSRAIYGEGKYHCDRDGVVYPDQRIQTDLDSGDFEVKCPLCTRDVTALPTAEDSPPKPVSVYGATKVAQEHLVRQLCESMAIPFSILRFQNVYGPGQSLSNPYTGILAIFSNRLRTGGNINIFEDGKESRDFVYVDDVVSAIAACFEHPESHNIAINIGSGEPTSVLDIARMLSERYDSSSEIAVSSDYRLGDIRHNFADTSLARETIGFEPRTGLTEGIRRFCEWVSSQPTIKDDYEHSLTEMKAKGLMK